jgi:carbon storage regulator
MLVLTREKNQRIVIGDNIVITVISIHGSKVRLAVEAPIDISVDRAELAEKKRQDGRDIRERRHYWGD